MNFKLLSTRNPENTCSIKLIFICILLIHITSHARHSIAPTFHYTYIKTTQDDQYGIYSPAISYTNDFDIRNYRLYLGVSMLFPVWASQNGKSFYNPDYYSTCFGTDLFIGISRDYPIANHICFVPAIGWHQNGIRLRGKSEYRDFYSLTSGLGFNFLTKYQSNHKWFNYGFLLFGADFIDHLYTKNKLKHGFSLSMGIGHSF